MTSSYISLAQFAPQLALAGTGADISRWNVIIESGGVARSLATGFADAPFIEWFGSCGLGGDDTAVFTRAVQSGIPFRLGPKTYIVNGSWSSGAVPFVLMSGYTGVSRLLRMEGGVSGAWIGLECSTVSIEGVIFDANGGQVAANTWSVLLDKSVNRARLRGCAFRNNSGALGRGLAVIGSGASGQSCSYVIDSCEFSGNASDGCGIFQAWGVSVLHCQVFNNLGNGIGVSVTGSASATNTNRNLIIQGNFVSGNSLDGINIGTINPSAASPPIYTLSAPSVAGAAVLDNQIWENGSYAIQAYGDQLDISGNQITQLGAGAGGIVMTARHSRLSRNSIIAPGAYSGIDTGGCYDCEISYNSVVGCGVGINPGGSQLVTVVGNHLIDCGVGMSIYAVETDGNGVAFPQPVTDLTVAQNIVSVGSQAKGVVVFDGSQNIVISDNRFVSSGGVGAADDALALWTDGVILRGNTWNGQDRHDVAPDLNGVLEMPDVFDIVRIVSGGQIIDSVLPSSAGSSVGTVSFLTVLNPGSGYTQASVTIDGAGSGAVAVAIVYGGRLIGFRVTARGTGYDPTATTCRIDGDGSGAQATVVVGTPLPKNRRISMLVPQGAILKYFGKVMTQANATERDLVLGPASAVALTESDGSWLLSGFYKAA